MRIVFMGTPPAAARSLQKLVEDGQEVVAVYTQPDRPSGRGNKIVFSAVKELALQNNLPVYQPAKLKNEALIEFGSHAADVAVVVAYGRILPEGFLNAYPMGAINVHFSLLPKYRGAAPVNWAIVNGETSTGVTVMKMDAGLDTGDILMVREMQIGEDETAPELMERLSEIGADLLSEALSKFQELKPISQDHSAATYAPIMKREDGLIDWNLTAKEISNRVRGFQPFPGSFAFLDGKRVVIWSARPIEYSDENAFKPSQVVEIQNGQIVVAAGKTTFLLIDEIQFEGKKKMTVREALNGVRISVGDRFS